MARFFDLDKLYQNHLCCPGRKRLFASLAHVAKSRPCLGVYEGGDHLQSFTTRHCTKPSWRFGLSKRQPS
jgi:hypothetical protein